MFSSSKFIDKNISKDWQTIDFNNMNNNVSVNEILNNNHNIIDKKIESEEYLLIDIVDKKVKQEKIKNNENIVIKKIKTIIKPHSNNVHFLSKFYEDKNTFISTGLDKYLKIWDIEKEKTNFQILINKYLITKIYSGDKNIIIYGDNHGGIYSIDVRDKNRPIKQIQKHQKYITDIQFCKNNNMMISCGFDHKILFTEINNLASKNFLYKYKLKYKGVHSFAFTKKKMLITNGTKNTINIWDDNFKKIKKKLKYHKKEIHKLKLINNNQNIISSSYDYSIVCWDLNTNKPISFCNKYNPYYENLEIINDKYILFQDFDYNIKIWDPITNKIIYTSFQNKVYKSIVNIYDSYIITAYKNDIYIHKLKNLEN